MQLINSGLERFYFGLFYVRNPQSIQYIYVYCDQLSNSNILEKTYSKDKEFVTEQKI